jgi:hypothetical protein
MKAFFIASSVSVELCVGMDGNCTQIGLVDFCFSMCVGTGIN